MDISNGFWFLPGGVEKSESIEDAAEREAVEEFGLKIRVNRIDETFDVTLGSAETREEMRVPPFVVVHASPIKGQLKTEYAPKRQLVLIRKEDYNKLLHELRIPREYECMKPYYYVSREVVRELRQIPQL